MKNQLLPKKLRELRKIHCYTQDYVASVLGVVRQTYSHYETGKRSPSPEMIVKLAGLYKVSVDDLLHMSIELERSVFFDAPEPTQSAGELAEYLAFFENLNNQKKYRNFSNLEKELFYYFEKVSENDKKEIIEILKIKAKKSR